MAISDELRTMARPLATLVRTNRRNDLRRLRQIVSQHHVRCIVVGHPLNLDGTAGEMAAEAARFAARVEKQTGLPVELVDERLTSWEAERTLAEARGKLRRRSRAGIDEVAAALLLREYLERSKGPTAEEPRVEDLKSGRGEE